MITYPFKATYEIDWKFLEKKNKEKFFRRLGKYIIPTDANIKEKLSKSLFYSKAENFDSISFFGHTDPKSVIFVDKTKYRTVLHLFSNSKPSFKEHILCLENKIISNPRGITKFIPATLYPIEYLTIYVKNIKLERVRRRRKIKEYIGHSILLYISPLIIIYQKAILSLNIPQIDYQQAISLLIIYSIISIYNIYHILGDKHEIRL